MKNLTQSEALAAANLLENVLQSFAVGGSKLTGKELVAAVEPGSVEPALKRVYLKLRAS